MNDTILQLISIVFTFLVGIGGTYWLVAKKYIRVAKEAADVLIAIYDAGVDDNISEAEFQAIIAESKEFYNKMKELKGAK